MREAHAAVCARRAHYTLYLECRVVYSARFARIHYIVLHYITLRASRAQCGVRLAHAILYSSVHYYTLKNIVLYTYHYFRFSENAFILIWYFDTAGM